MSVGEALTNLVFAKVTDIKVTVRKYDNILYIIVYNDNIHLLLFITTIYNILLFITYF